MGIEYAISGGQLHFDKRAFTRELLLSNSPLKKILRSEIDVIENKQPIITKTDDCVNIDYNDASDIELDANFGELFEGLKAKHKEKMKGKITIRITLYDSYYMVLDFDKEE